MEITRVKINANDEELRRNILLRLKEVSGLIIEQEEDTERGNGMENPESGKEEEEILTVNGEAGDSLSDILGKIALSGNLSSLTLPNVRLNAPEPRILALCSVRGGIGCTTLSLALGRILSRNYGEEVLYINLASFHNWKNNPLAPEGEGCDLGKIFFMMSRLTDFSLRDFTQSDEEIHCLFGNFPGICPEMLDEELLSRIKEYAGREHFGIIILDIGDRISYGKEEILAEKDISIQIGTDLSELNLFAENRTGREKEKPVKKISVLLERNRYQEISLPEDGTIWIPGCDSITRKSLFEDYGKGVSCLAEEIMERLGEG